MILLKDVVDVFSSSSGLKPNLGKSDLIIVGVDDQMRAQFQAIWGFKEGALLAKYLDIPLNYTRLKFSQCKNLIDNIRGKVMGCSNRCLTYAGRRCCWVPVGLFRSTGGAQRRVLRGVGLSVGVVCGGSAAVFLGGFRWCLVCGILCAFFRRGRAMDTGYGFSEDVVDHGSVGARWRVELFLGSCCLE
ncbi:hypothetical protein Droror1_Dr00025612 [Drosera rotundifolia]